MQCSLCQKTFTQQLQPYYTCVNKHSVCRTCIKEVFGDYAIAVCPECRVDICRSQIQNKILPDKSFDSSMENTVNNFNYKNQNKCEYIQKSVIPSVKLFWAKMLVISSISWATQIITYIYILNLGGRFRLGFLYPIVFRFYQIVRNRSQYVAGSHRLILKLGLFGFMEQLSEQKVLFHLQFAIRWILAVSGIISVQYYYKLQWSVLPILALVFNGLSMHEIYTSRKIIKTLLDQAVTQYEWLTPAVLIVLLIAGLITSFANIIFLFLSWYPIALIFLICWATTLIFSITSQKVRTCCSTFLMCNTLCLSFAYSIGMFCWLAIKHQLNRIPAITMVIFRYLVCPIATVGFVVSDPDSALKQNWMLIASALCVYELSFSIFLNSKT